MAADLYRQWMLRLQALVAAPSRTATRPVKAEPPLKLAQDASFD